MPSTSKAQQKFMGMVHALQKGELEPSSVSKSVKDAAKNMKKSDAKDFASTKHKGLPKKVKQEILNKLKEYANKMGRDHLGGDDYTSSKKGGLRDFDGYDNVDYNKDMPMDEGFKSEYKGNDGIIWKKGKTRGGVTNFIPYYKGHNIDFGGHNFKTEKELKDFIKDYILSNQLYRKYRNESVNERADYKYLTQVILDAKPKYDVYYNSSHNVVNIGGVGYDGGDLVKNFNQKPGSSSKIKNNFYHAHQDPQKTKREVEKLSKGKIKVKVGKGGFLSYSLKESVNEGMFSTIDQIRQDSKDVRDFIKKVFADRDFKDMKNDKEFLKYLKSIYEGVDESKGVPQNYMQGRTSDYHTALRGKNRDYSGGTNFKKTNHGQPDLENDEEDQETNQLSNKQIALKAESFKVAGRPVKLNKGKKKNGTDWTVTFKNGKTVPLSDVLSLIKPFPKITKESFDKVEHLKLLNLALRTMPGSQKQKEIIRKLNQVRKAGGMRPLKETSIIEYGQRLDLSFIEDEEARLDGTPKPKDAINRDLDEGTMIRMAGKLAHELLPKDVWYRHAKDPKKNKEFVKSVVKDLAQTLNRFYKSHNINVKIKEQLIRELGVWRIDHYTGSKPGTIVPAKMIATVLNDKDKEKKKAVERDLAGTLNTFWKRWKIPFRIDLNKKG